MPGPRGGGVPFREALGTPLIGDAPRMMLLGSGEIGREIAIEAMRLGAEVIALDRYPNAPAMQVAHRHHILPMTDGAALRAVVERERPDVLVPEIEQIDTETLLALEGEGYHVVPTATATRATMNRERIRRLAAEEARVPTSRYAFADSPEEARTAAASVGFPCLLKAITSSSGHGMTIVRGPEEVPAAYVEAAQGGRVPNRRVMIEEFVTFDQEVTVLVLRHYDRRGELRSTVLDPIGHHRPGTLYHESWQPATVSAGASARLKEIPTAVTDRLGGVGIFGVECFVRGDDVWFSEVSPRPHDTGLVTLGSQWNSEFALHARAILGLPYEGPEPTVPAAAHVILSPGAGWAPSFPHAAEGLSVPGVRLFLFGKPEGYADRRLGVAVARASDIPDARRRAEEAAHLVEREIRLRSSSASPRAH